MTTTRPPATDAAVGLAAPDADDVLAVKTPFLDVLLLTVVVLLLRALGPAPAHAIDIEPPTVAGAGASPLVSAETPVVIGLDAAGRLTVDDRPTSLEQIADALAPHAGPHALLRVSGDVATTATLDLVSRIRPMVRSVQIQVRPAAAASPR